MPDESLSVNTELFSAYNENQWQSLTYTDRVAKAREGLRKACETELIGQTKLLDWIEKHRAADQPTSTAKTQVQQQMNEATAHGTNENTNTQHEEE